MADIFDLFKFKPSTIPYLHEIEVILRDNHTKMIRFACITRTPDQFETDKLVMRQEAHTKLDALLDAMGLR